MARNRVATAYVTLLPSTDGFFRSFSRDMNRAGRDANRTLSRSMGRGGLQAGSLFSGNFLGGLGGIGSKLTSMFTSPIRGIGNLLSSTIGSAVRGVSGIITSVLSTAVKAGMIGVGTALAGATVAAGAVVKGGLSRVLNIEDATAKLGALKYNAESIKSVTKSAMDSVLGTTYSFDQAMKVSVQGLAAGIKEGDQLTSYLKLISDTATVSGASLEDIGYIFNKVQGNGRVLQQEMNMLSDRGIPIVQMMAKEANVSILDFRKMMKGGKVDSSVFLNAIQKNLAGAGTLAASTTRGFLANTKAAYSRLGAVIAGGGVPIFRQMLQDLIPAIDALSKKLTPIMENLWKVVEGKVGPVWKSWMESITDGGFDVNSGFLGQVWGLIQGIQGHVQSLIDIMPDLWESISNSEVGGIFSQIATDVYDFITHLMPLGEIFTNVIMPAVQPFVDIFAAVIPIIYQALLDLGAIISENYTTWGASLGSFFGSIVSFFQTNGPVIGEFLKTAMTGASGLFTTIFDNMTMFVTWFTDKISESGPQMMDAFKMILPILAEVSNALTGIGILAVTLGPQFMYFAIGMGLLISVAMDLVTSVLMGIGIIVVSIIKVFELIANTVIVLMNGLMSILTFGNFEPVGLVEFVNYDFLANFEFQTPKYVDSLSNATLPEMATGGNVGYRPGGTAMIVGEKAPETITDRGKTNRMMEENTRLSMMAMKRIQMQNAAPVQDNRQFHVDNGNNIDPKVLAREIYKLDKKSLRG